MFVVPVTEGSIVIAVSHLFDLLHSGSGMNDTPGIPESAPLYFPNIALLLSTRPGSSFNCARPMPASTLLILKLYPSSEC